MTHLIRLKVDTETLNWLDEVGWGYPLADVIREVLREAKRYGLPRRTYDPDDRRLVVRVDDQLYDWLCQVKEQASLSVLASAILRQARDEGLFPIWEEPNWEPLINQGLMSRKVLELAEQEGEEPTL